MVDPDSFAILVGVVVLATQVGVAVWIAREHGLLPNRSKTDWSNALRSVADDLGLEHRSIPTSFDSLRGSIGRSDIRVGSESDDDVVTMKIEVFHPTLKSGLGLRRTGARMPRGESFGARVLVGDATLDGAVELAGANAALVEALRTDAELRKRTLAVIRDLGAVLDDRHLVLTRATFARNPEEVLESLVPMIELVHRLERPHGFHGEGIRGSEWTVRLRRAKQRDSDETRAAAIAFLESLAPTYGGAEVFAPDSESGVELRGTYRGHPLRIELDSSFSPELTIKHPSCGEMLSIEQDPDLDASDAHPPAWDESSEEKFFLGRTTYVEDSRACLAPIREELEAMPVSIRTALGTDLARHGVRYFRPDANQVWVMFWPTLDEMPDPVATIETTLALMLAVSAHRAAHPMPRALDDDDSDDD